MPMTPKQIAELSDEEIDLLLERAERRKAARENLAKYGTVVTPPSPKSKPTEPTKTEAPKPKPTAKEKPYKTSVTPQPSVTTAERQGPKRGPGRPKIPNTLPDGSPRGSDVDWAHTSKVCPKIARTWLPVSGS